MSEPTETPEPMTPEEIEVLIYACDLCREVKPDVEVVQCQMSGIVGEHRTKMASERLLLCDLCYETVRFKVDLTTLNRKT